MRFNYILIIISTSVALRLLKPGCASRPKLSSAAPHSSAKFYHPYCFVSNVLRCVVDMSDSYILLIAQLSKPVDPSLNLLQIFSSTLPSKLENEENPIRSVLLLSPQSGIVWARGLSVSEVLVSKTFDLGDSLSVDFEFPRSQPSYLVEIVPKKKNTSLDLKKFQSVFDSLQSSFRGAVVMLLSECRIVVKFADPDEAVAQCASFVEPMKEDGVQTITSRTILIKEHVVMRAFYVGGSQTFAEFERAHKAAHNQSSTDFLNSKFSHFKDRPTVLSMQALPVSTEKLDFGGQTSEEVNIACATHYDYRLLRNSPPVSFPGTHGGSLVLRVNLEAKIRKSATTGASEVTPTAVSGPPALAPPPNLPHPSSFPAASASVGATSSVSSAVSPATTATSNAPVPANAYIFWDYGSCPVDEEIASPEDVDSSTVSLMATNIRAVIDRYAQFRKDTGHPVKVNQCFRHVFAPQGNTFKNIEKIPTTWGAFTKNEFKVHHYSRKCSADSLLRGVIEGVLKAHARSGEASAPLLLCFVTNDPEFASIAAYLKLEHQNDIILVHNSAANTVTSLVRKHYNWNAVQDIVKSRKAAEPVKKNAKGAAKEATKATEAKEIKKQDARDGRSKASSTTTTSSNDARNHSVPLEELEDGEVHEGEGLLIIPPGKELVPWSAGDDVSSGMFAFGIEDDPQLQNKKKGNSAKEKDSNKTQGKSGGEISHTLSSASADSTDDAQNAPTWRVARSCGTGGNEGESSPKFDLKYSSVATYLKRLLHWRRQQDDESGTQARNYLLGEDTTGYPEDIALVCYVRIEINSKAKKFSFQVRGPTAGAVEQRFLRIKSLAEECIKNRQSHSFNTWIGGQRTALIGSEVLALQERACCAVAMFHYSGNTTVAEIVALRSVQHNAMLKFIQKLRPKEVTITVPYAFVCWYDNDMWEKMRMAFAVKAFVTDEAGEPIKVKTGYISPEEADTMVNVRLVGFGPKLIDRAVEHIQLNDEREEIVPVDTSDEATAAQTLAAMSISSNASSGRGKDKEKTTPTAAASAGSGRTVVAAPSMSGPPAVQSHVGTREDMLRASPVTIDTRATKMSEDSSTGFSSPTALTPTSGVHKAVYTFADREAGIYFYSFDTAFREYLNKAFGVFVDDTEHAAQLSLMESGADYKTDTLKVTLCGKVLKQVQAARTYMDQFNTNVLGRYRIFFPRVSARKYKEIYNKKATQVQKMLNVRQRETQVHSASGDTSDPAGCIDPFKIPGFVNIRSKPAMLLNSKVNFPLDITVTICGPSLSAEGKAMLDQNRTAFNAIPSEFSVAAIVIPPTHHMKAVLTLKTEREELVKRFNLVAMRWEEGLKSSGSVGTVKIWAYTKASLKTILQEIFRTDMGGAPAQHATEDNESYVGPPVSMTSAFTMASVPHPLPGAAPGTATSAATTSAAPIMQMAAPVPVPVSMSAPVPVINGVRASNGYAALNITPPSGQPQQPRPMMNMNNNMNHNGGPPYPPVPPSSQPGVMQAGNVKIFANAKGAIRPLERVSPVPMPMSMPAHVNPSMPMPQPEPNLSKAVIRLPDLSLRFVMQGEPLKSKLNDVLERLLKIGAYIAYPFKDRTDPHACFELEGTPPVLARAAEELNDFIQRATRSLRAVQVIVNNEQFMLFTKGGDGIPTGMNPAVTEFQAAHGVHLVFNPPTVSSREAFSLVDMRLMSELAKKDAASDAFGALDPALDLQLSPKAVVDKEMVSVMVYNCYSQRSVEIAIISSNSSESGWTWGVNNLLLLVGSNTLGYSPVEVEQLNRGEVLVHTDRLTGKTILRIKPSAHTRGVNYQAAVLTNALLKCLQKANELGLKGLAISAPTDIDAFPDLNPEDIRALTVEAVVEFSKKCRSYLRFTKLVCIELGYNTVSMNNALELAATPQIPAAMAALERQLEPGQKDRMVRTLAALLERNENEHNDEVLQSTYQPHPHPQHGQQHGGLYGGPRGAPGHPRPHVPGGPYPGQGPMQGPGAPRADVRSKMSILTCNVPLPVSLLPALASHERPRGFKVFLVKGLLSSVVKSLDQIKLLLAAPKPIEHDLPINMEDFY